MSRKIKLNSKDSSLDEGAHNYFLSILEDSDTTAWSLQDLSLAEVPAKHYFELTGLRPIQHGPRRMASRNDEILRK